MIVVGCVRCVSFVWFDELILESIEQNVLPTMGGNAKQKSIRRKYEAHPET